jgi:uncharacterized protein (TIGR02118 family)
MVKLMYALRRRPEMTREAFQEYWRTRHAPLVRSHAAALGIRRYVQVHTAHDEVSRALPGARGRMGEPYDGVAELWIDGLEDLARRMATQAGLDAARALLEDERAFIDFERSAMWLADEHVIIAG